MNTIDDLRAALGREASFDDTEALARPGEVQQRVREVRRRRATIAAATTVVVALVAVAGGTLLRGGSTPEPAGPVRVRVPDQVRVSGFPYTLAHVAHPSSGEVVRSTDRSRAAVLVATGLGEGTATLLAAGGQPVARLTADGSSAPIPVGFLGTNLRIEVDGAPDADIRLAFYEPTGQLADGVDNGTAVFRDLVGGLERVDARFAEPGARGVTMTVRGALPGLTFMPWCSPSAKGLQIQISIDGDLPAGEPCSQTDAADGGGSSIGAIGGDPGAREHTVHVFLTRGRGLDPVSEPGVAFGVGAYRPVDGPQVLGMRMPRRVEYDGRRWTLDDVITGQSADIRTGADERLMRIVGHGDGVTATWSGREDDEGTTAEVHDFRVGMVVDGTVLLPGDTYHMEVSAPAAIVVYRPE